MFINVYEKIDEKVINVYEKIDCENYNGKYYVLQCNKIYVNNNF